MKIFMPNYRKGKKSDIKCHQCGHYRQPCLRHGRGRCGDSPAVGKNHTCDNAYIENGRNRKLKGKP